LFQKTLLQTEILSYRGISVCKSTSSWTLNSLHRSSH